MTTPTVEQRLEALERSNQRLRAVALAAVSLSLIGVGTGLLRTRAPEELRARQLSLTDEAGAVRARMAATEQGGFALTVSDATGRPRTMLGVDGDGSPRFGLAGSEGQALAEIATLGSAARLLLRNGDGRDFFEVSLQVDGSSRMQLSDQLGRPRATLSTEPDGTPELTLKDHLGVSRADLSVSSAGAPRLLLEGRDGKVFRAPAVD